MQEEKGYGKPPKAYLFKKGQSGNPTGKPKKTKEVKQREYDIRYALRQLFNLTIKIPTDKKIDLMEPYLGKDGRMRCIDIALVRVLQRAMNGDLKCMRELLDRNFGKPIQMNANLNTDSTMEDADKIRDFFTNQLK